MRENGSMRNSPSVFRTLVVEVIELCKLREGKGLLTNAAVVKGKAYKLQLEDFSNKLRGNYFVSVLCVFAAQSF